ncbi:ACP phosphodiesterase [Altererythrobacter sp. B11]|uniref:NADPH-dependent FMN reductase n=1 Tax=Altererythrobacter sp. B11 TaxID=2060312 RepID=UPI000DC739D7|nr:NAD(P)H-dependent oxidoreductase [Altererythrobacter sp. B11]BBC73336.1 ACP phosphodiesterase [Altererythrobacter sp. B11]
MAELLNIGILVGSLQRDGLSRRLANAVIALGDDRVKMQIVEIGDLPLYNPELEDAGMAAWQRFRSEIAPLDGILFVTPEYNRSVPAPLKNAIDVGSRPYGQSVWAGKPAGILSQSPGALGAFGANHHLRQSLVFLDMPAMQQPEAYLGHSANLFAADGSLVDGSAKDFISSFINAFASWVKRHTAGTA